MSIFSFAILTVVAFAPPEIAFPQAPKIVFSQSEPQPQITESTDDVITSVIYHGTIESFLAPSPDPVFIAHVETSLLLATLEDAVNEASKRLANMNDVAISCMHPDPNFLFIGFLSFVGLILLFSRKKPEEIAHITPLSTKTPVVTEEKGSQV